MNRLRIIHPIRRWAVLLAGLAGVLITSATAAPAAFAHIIPPEHDDIVRVIAPSHPARIMVSGGMPGWQVALIAVGAALAAAIMAVVLDRARTARRRMVRAAA